MESEGQWVSLDMTRVFSENVSKNGPMLMEERMQNTDTGTEAIVTQTRGSEVIASNLE